MMVVRLLTNKFATPTLVFARLLATPTLSADLREDLLMPSPRVTIVKPTELATLAPPTPTAEIRTEEWFLTNPLVIPLLVFASLLSLAPSTPIAIPPPTLVWDKIVKLTRTASAVSSPILLPLVETSMVVKKPDKSIATRLLANALMPVHETSIALEPKVLTAWTTVSA
jgi:hypothetical protein